ncbi:MAG: type VI secretion system tip protein VgrG [Roseivirga sp.]|nr:type VI secretion system tip protein VgrG [Roseivirga sp.]
MSVQVTDPVSTGIVSFKVIVNGNDLNSSLAISAVMVHKEVNKIPFARITLHDGDVTIQDFEASNEAYAAPGAEVEIQAGYEFEDVTIFKGILTRQRISAGSGKTSLLMIECRDKAVSTTLGRKNACFHEVSDSDAIEEILGNYDLSPEVEATEVTHKELVQYHATDWDFILSRTEANGQLIMLQDDAFIIAKPDASKTPVLVAGYGNNILSFEAETEARFQYAAVTSKSWSAADQDLVEDEAEEPDLGTQGDLPGDELADVIGLESLDMLHAGQLPVEELKAMASAQLLKSRLGRIIGTVSIQGNADIKLGEFITLEGVGNRYNGDAFITGIRHEISNGNWLSHIQFGLSPEWFYEKKSINHPPASGLLPAISGLHIGIVIQLQDDPDSEERILIKVPAIDAEDEGIWARVARPDAGDSRGIFFMPEIDDEVVIGYLNDDPRNPIVLGMLHSSAKPAPITANDDNHEKGIVTRDELKVLFNDELKSMELSTPNGNKILLSDDEGAINIEDENGNKLMMNSDGITIESAKDLILKASGDVTVEGTNIGIAANAEFKAEGSAGAELSTGAIAVLKGSLVQIN